MGDISKHFDTSEATCRCGCGQTIINPALVGLLEAIRARYDAPIMVESWNRCEEWNEVCKGVLNSYHVQGLAADIYVIGYTDLNVLAKTAEEVGADGVGIYWGQGFVHVDMRSFAEIPGESGARWTE